MRVCGIYKITSPTGRIYIGQSYDIYERWRGHKREYRASGFLQRSFIKHGNLNHKFEIIHELPFDTELEVMDRYEQLYMDLYKDAGFPLLNSRGAGSRGKLSDETKRKLSIARTGSKASKECRLKMSLSSKGRKKSKEHKQKIGLSHVRRPKFIEAFTGEKNIKAKLTGDQVLEIRSKHLRQKKGNNISLAKEYGVSVSTIERINSKGKAASWLHLLHTQTK